jgi:hypothetical protein
VRSNFGEFDFANENCEGIRRDCNKSAIDVAVKRERQRMGKKTRLPHEIVDKGGLPRSELRIPNALLNGMW